MAGRRTRAPLPDRLARARRCISFLRSGDRHKSPVGAAGRLTSAMAEIAFEPAQVLVARDALVCGLGRKRADDARYFLLNPHRPNHSPAAQRFWGIVEPLHLSE
jgi:hypothetical protein